MLVVAAVFVSICMHTKPDRDMHLNELSSAVMAGIRTSAPAGIEIPDEVIAKIERDSLVATMLDKMMVLEDYVAFTVGKVFVGDDGYPISVGLFGNVFALSQEDMMENFVYKMRERKLID